MFHDNSSDCAKILENIQENYELDNCIRYTHKDTTISKNRDMILERAMDYGNDSEKYMLCEDAATEAVAQSAHLDYK